MARTDPQVRTKAAAALVVLLVGCSMQIPSPTGGPSQSGAVTPTASPASKGVDSTMVVMAAGDIACDPVDPTINLGRGTATRCRQADTARLLSGADLILTLGDNQYECGGLTAYRASFDRSWGAFKSRIRPAIGNHEHNATGSKGVGTSCDATRSGGGYFTYFGSAAPAGAYSFDMGGWHFATVDSTCGLSAVHCAAEAMWLATDLAAHPVACSLVFYHHPRWSSGGHGDILTSDPFWRVAAAAGVDVILSGHDHDYERFAPMAANGGASAAGVREFVVGTGGRNFTAFSVIQRNSVVRNANTFGVLKLTMHPTSYDWQFLPIAGQTFTDRGSGSCH